MLTSVTSPAAANSGKPSAFSATITLPPRVSGANSSKTDKSKQIDVAAKTPANSAPLKTSCAQCSITPALPCVMATPFGWPVDPDV